MNPEILAMIIQNQLSRSKIQRIRNIFLNVMPTYTVHMQLLWSIGMSIAPLSELKIVWSVKTILYALCKILMNTNWKKCFCLSKIWNLKWWQLKKNIRTQKFLKKSDGIMTHIYHSFNLANLYRRIYIVMISFM